MLMAAFNNSTKQHPLKAAAVYYFTPILQTIQERQTKHDVNYRRINSLSVLLRCGTRPNKYGLPIKLELPLADLLVMLVNHYTTRDALGTAGVAETNSSMTFSYTPLHKSTRKNLHSLAQTDTGHYLENQSSAMTDRDGW